MLRFMRIVHPKSTRAVSYPVLVPFTERISDYCICFALSSGLRAPSAPHRGISTVFTNYSPYRPTATPRSTRAARAEPSQLLTRRIAIWRLVPLQHILRRCSAFIC